MDAIRQSVLWYHDLSTGYQISFILTAYLFYSYFKEAERAPQDKLVVLFYLVVIGVYTAIYKGLTILF